MHDVAPTARIRADAARIVAEVTDRGRSLDDTLAADSDEGSARGLKRSLCYGTLRWHFRLVAIVKALAERPPEKLQPSLRALIEVGLYQLISGDVAEHAAVSETVNATRALGLPKASGFVNALLRRFQREREAVLHAVDRDLSIRTAHPRWLVEALRHERPDVLEAVLDENNRHPPLWLRVNRMRATVADVRRDLEAAGFQAEPHPFAPDALRVTPPADVRTLPGFDAGRFSVQDAAAQLAVELLTIEKGERILDACAAPGGKTCHLLERAGGAVEVTALDVSEARLQRVRENLDRLGLSAQLIAGDAIAPETWWDGRPYDRILLDVPCSATGVIRRHPDIKILRRERDIPALAQRQRALLRTAWGLLRPGGTLLYTSCSVLAAENSRTVAGFLSRHPEARDRTPELTAAWPARPPGEGPGYQFMPGEAGMDGFYFACLRNSL
jgi:16S rRNA (cytosine967-C5)-methyltransferase